MAFKKEILNFLTPLKTPFGFRYTVVDGVGGYFENVLKIGEISTYSLTLLYKRGVFTVSGYDLEVTKYCDGDLAVSGVITKIEREE